MVAHLSQAWLDRYRQLAADLPVRKGATARLQHVVAKTPEGDVTYVVAFEDGRLAAASLGGDEAAEITLTETYADAQAMARGDLDLHVGFMQGRVKLAGDMGAFLELVPVLQSPEHRAALAALAAETEL
jgi:putative sterol carrier protein